MRNIMVFLLVMSFSFLAQANYEVERLMDSYLIAKAETHKSPVTDEQAKKTPFTIQVASYVNEKDAVSHVEELKVQEKDVFYYPAFVRGTVWYKVCVGKFTKHTDAEAYRKKFVKRMDEPFSVVISMLERPTSRDVASTDPMSVKLIKKDKPKEAIKTATTTGEDFYTLQVGAFPTEKSAQDQLSKITLTGGESFIREASVDGKTWYRLFVGKFNTHKDAKDFQQALSEQTPKLDSFIRKMK